MRDLAFRLGGLARAAMGHLQPLPRRRDERADERGLAQARVADNQELDEFLPPETSGCSG